MSAGACAIDQRGAAPVAGDSGGAGTGALGGAGVGGIGGAVFGGGGTTTGGSAGGGGTTAGGSAGSTASGGAGASDDAGDGDSNAGEDCTKHPGSHPLLLGTSLHCYWRSTTSAKFVQAAADCAASGGYLATLHSQQENAFVQSLAGPDTFWIGASDSKGPTNTSCGAGAYGWVTSEPFAYTNWGDSNPDCVCGACAGNCDCQHRAVMLPDGTWRDRYEGDSNFWVCEAGAFSS